MHSSIPTDPSNALLPGTHITATTILGGTVPGLDTLGQTLATHLASAISGASDGREGRMLVLGLGLDRKMERVNPEEFADLVGLALDVM
jgi:proteasome assembly chaperone 3